MRRVFVPILVSCGVTLALVIGARLTPDSLAVVLGVAVGVAASVPTSILLVALIWRAQRGAPPADVPAIRSAAPPPAEPRQLPARRQP